MLEPERIRNSLRYLTQRLAALEGLHTGNYLLGFKQFVEYLERQDELGLARLLHAHPEGDPLAWYQRTTQASALAPLPADRWGRFALAYRFVFAVSKDKIDIMWIAGNYFDGAHIGEKLHRLKEFMIYPFVEELTALANDAIGKLTDDGEAQDPQAFLRELLAAPTPAKARSPDRVAKDHPLAEELDELELALGRLERMGLPDKDLKNLRADLTIVHLELSKHHPVKERLVRRLEDLEKWDVLTKAAKTAREAVQEQL